MSTELVQPKTRDPNSMGESPYRRAPEFPESCPMCGQGLVEGAEARVRKYWDTNALESLRWLSGELRKAGAPQAARIVELLEPGFLHCMSEGFPP